MANFLDTLLKKRRCLPLTETQGALASKYRYFKSLLNHNQNALKAIADMEQLYYRGTPFSLTSVRIKYEELLEAVSGVVFNLEALSGKDFSILSEAARRIDGELFQNFNPKCMIATRELVVPLEEITDEMKRVVGSKAANLATIRNEIGLPVPAGFSITAYAFERFIEDNRLLRPIKEELSHVTSESPEDIELASSRLKAMILGAEVPSYLEGQIMTAYGSVEEKTSRGIHVAMRSSAIGEDTEATFAGQYETVLNVGKEDLLEAYKQVLASKYAARAIAYRLQYGLDDRETPMAVVAIAMVDARASGVLYSVDPSLTASCPVKINSLWGLGEHLVDGSASPDTFIVDRISGAVLERQIARKESRLMSRASGGIAFDHVPEEERDLPSLDEETASQLAKYGLLLEEFFESPQDVEWAVGRDNSLFILQSRPLHLPEVRLGSEPDRAYPDHPLLLSGGKTASPGIALGRVFVVARAEDLREVPPDSILVARTASPEYAKVIGRIKGIITDIGSVTSHMASVAREFGIPAIVDAGEATSLLPSGEMVTMSSDTARVYRGTVEELLREMRPAKRLIFDSPLHRRLRGILDTISPLNLTDAGSDSFSPEGCKTYHDIVRFTHEMAIREMFGLSETAEQAGASVRLASKVPLDIRLVDLGRGLRKGLTTCDTITPDSIESIPLRALWRGFTHPGVSWAGTMRLEKDSFTSRLAASATAEFGEVPGGESYAVVSADYLNLSARFAYHFATLDTLCGESSSQNYISLQFAGGGGNYYGRSLRVQLMGSILDRMGFRVSLKGDLIEASFPRYDRKSTEDALDLTGRLLASSRLLDMSLSTQDEIEIYTEAFFSGAYDFLTKKREDDLPGFYLQGGHWKRVVEDGHAYCLQDGSKWGRRIVAQISGIVGKVVGASYQEFLDTIEAYYYFPLAVLKDTQLKEGTVSVKIRPMGGNIDRAGGIAFGIKGVDNYFVLRTNALEGNVILFEYVNGKRFQRRSVRKRIETGAWHLLGVEIRERIVRGILDGQRVMEFGTDKSLDGFVGLWTKADSVTCFDELTVETGGAKRIVQF